MQYNLVAAVLRGQLHHMNPVIDSTFSLNVVYDSKRVDQSHTIVSSDCSGTGDSV